MRHRIADAEQIYITDSASGILKQKEVRLLKNKIKGGNQYGFCLYGNCRGCDIPLFGYLLQ
jgi:hypothetical protein